MAVRRLTHGELTLALHELAAGVDESSPNGAAAARLLLVHELGGSTRGWGAPPRAALARFSRGVYGLDLAGHGESDWRRGGAYTPELFAADVALALAELGPCLVAGAGIGAYVALLVAGARPDLVPAALLLPGRGLAGGGAMPDFGRLPPLVANLDRLASESGDGAPDATAARFDPLVASCVRDVRPTDYASALAGSARRLLLSEDGKPDGLPPWWCAVRDRSAAMIAPRELSHALEALARLAGSPPA